MKVAEEYARMRDERIVLARFGALREQLLAYMPAVMKQLAEDPNYSAEELVEYLLRSIDGCGRGDIHIHSLKR